MSSTLVLLFHPDPARSRANAALAAAAARVPGVEVRDMAAAYPDGHLDLMADGAVEAARLIAAERIVLQFPVQWYSVPPLLKAWMDAVLTRMFYVRPDTEGRALEGTPLMVAATAGNVPEAYAPDGANGFTMEELFAPLRATARRCRLPWAEPFVLYRAKEMDAEALDEAGADYAARLRAFAARPSARALVEA